MKMLKKPDDLVDKDAHGMDSNTVTEQDILDQLSTLDANIVYGSDEIPQRPLIKKLQRK